MAKSGSSSSSELQLPQKKAGDSLDGGGSVSQEWRGQTALEDKLLMKRVRRVFVKVHPEVWKCHFGDGKV